MFNNLSYASIHNMMYKIKLVFVFKNLTT